MPSPLAILLATAASIGFVHTVIGPDHYVPFVMMRRAQQWTRRKTLWVTFLCGLGHVLSSVALGAVGVAFGVALQHLQLIESVRGELAAWALIAFGLVYGAWGLRAAHRSRTHAHTHMHEDGIVHEHGHAHSHAHAHAHIDPKRVMTTWALFTVFILGPCEPLIPLLMYPAAVHSTGGVALVAVVFGIVTVSTMMGMVLLVGEGVARIPLQTMERYTHALAGAVIALSGIAIQVLGL